MGTVKSLAKDTAIYGLSSIVGRFLNWLLVPLYTIKLATGEYGIVTNLYAYVALTLVILTYGMETGFFRFINGKETKEPLRVYSTSLISLAATSTLFVLLIWIFLGPISRGLDCASHPAYVMMLAVTVAIDAFTAIPFSYLRYQKKAAKFAVLKCINIAINIGLNLVFFFLMFNPEVGVGYIFFANLLASVALLPLLFKELTGFKWQLDFPLLKRMLKYSFPLLVLGVAGIMNQNLDKILFPFLTDDMSQLGIYGACCKVALVMMMFTQAFRFAYEPFIFAQNREQGSDKRKAYADAMKFFVIFAMVIFLGVMFYLPVLQHFIAADYRSGLKVVPIVMIADIFFGVFFNLSLWYKLQDKTIWGTWFSLIGLVVTIAGNIILVPKIGYMGCAWTAFACYGIMMLASYFVGRAKDPQRYEVGRISAYFFSALVLYAIGCMINTGSEWLDMAARTPLLLAYLFAILKFERIPLIHK
ncbi:MAG: oligosaccharide flippase family protein [Bacteroides sp.]|nr:oligosaccharide flippase family protein [Bacteroides sp.]MCM1379972.1 oligosaccharide flippase family protein [Bacteroides sp.]MCM1446273.1 oligosaccharide flippase family protein [Prevotella sp.]